MRTQQENRLTMLLNNHFPVSILREDYQSALRGKCATVDDSNTWLSHRVVSEFMVSEERKALDKQYEHDKYMVSNVDGDSDYFDKKGEL